MRRWKRSYSPLTELKSSMWREHSRGQLRVLRPMTTGQTRNRTTRQTDHPYHHNATKADNHSNLGISSKTIILRDHKEMEMDPSLETVITAGRPAISQESAVSRRRLCPSP